MFSSHRFLFRRIIISFFCLLFLMACSEEKHLAPEQAFLNIFELELQSIDEFSHDYIGYMRYQIKFYTKKTRVTNELIKQINEKYQDMEDDEKRDYQLFWQRKFQPIVDAIAEKTRELIVYETGRLTHPKRAIIQELSIKLEILEKEAPAEKLLPIFFIVDG